MENHPIPQDVTGFKFKLIGSVTLKQFLYILAGGILACICFVLPITPFIKLPLSFFFGGLGTALAFIPIEGRPMDVMLKNFMRALPAENQFIYKKRGAENLIADFFATPPIVKAAPITTPLQEKPQSNLDTKRALLYKTLKQAQKPDEKEQQALSSINSFLHDTATPVSIPVQNLDTAPQEPAPAHSQLEIVTPAVTIKTNEVDVRKSTQIVPPPAIVSEERPSPVFIQAQTVQNLEVPNAPLPQPIMQEATPTPLPKETPIAKPAPQIQEAESMTIPSMPETTNALPTDEVPLTTTAPAATLTGVSPNEATTVTSVTPEKSLKAGFPQLPDMPNIVMGIIKDPRGRVLPNILVEFMNQQGIPVRAFKTNALGQFAAATPLPDGNYVVILEDPRKQNEFEQINITLDGKIFEPLEIISIDQREKLRRELFGSATPAQPAGA